MIMKTVIRPETEMKDSGLQWLGEIPNDWKVSRVGNFFSFSSGDSLTNEEIRDEGMYLVYGANGIRGYYSKYNLDEKRILLGRVGALAGNVHIIDGKVWVTEHALIASNKLDLVEEYYGYVFESMNLIQYSKSSAQPVISGDTLQKLRFPVPKLSEQQSIADYLDETCSKIDEIIAEAKASIDEYKELKQSVIFEAVTKGLDKNVEMKDSCVEWIGEIPSSWQLRKLKTFTVMISKGTTPKDMSNVKTTLYCVRYLKSENIKNNHLDIVPEFYITEETHNELSRSKLNGNDILFVIAGASIGKVAIMDENLLPANTNQANAFIRIKDEFMDSIEYLWMLLQSVIVKEVINRYSVQSAQPNISMENLGNIKLPYPLLKRERDNIMNYLREKVDAIDSLIAEKESLINDLEAYKKSLIYEVVTGKRRVV